MKTNLKLISIMVAILIWGCTAATDIKTPARIGAKERVRVITGDRAVTIVNKMHNSEVAGHDNAIAEYGGDKKDFLYITYYKDPEAAQNAFDAMIDKMRAAKNSPFFHMMPLQKYRNKVYITLGIGTVHYIYVSGNFLLWLQTAQSFGDQLPPHLVELYPV